MKLRARILAILMICMYMIPSLTVEADTTSQTLTTEIEETDTVGTLGSVAIDYTYNDDPLDDVNFKVYCVAIKNESYQYEMQEGFEDIEIDFDSLAIDSYWISIRNNLENHISCNMIEWVHEFVTDEFGSYTLEGLEAGLYIIDAANVVEGTEVYFSDPILVMVGYYFESEEMWMYHYQVQPKSDVLAYTDDQELTITKVWNNVETWQELPESVEVELYCDGSVYETVVLSEENNWTYTWYNVDQLATWGVKELSEFEYFEVEYDKTYFDFEIINTYNGPEVLAAEYDESLPQTGTEAKMIPIFAGIGISLIAVGAFVDKKGKRNEK